MKYWTLVCIFLAGFAVAAEDMILVNEVTEETYDKFMNQYSESCRPHVKRWVGGASLAAAKFNEGNYYEASALINRYVKPGDFVRQTGSSAIMFSEECTLEDLVLTLAQGEALMPMIESTECMVRVTDSDSDWFKAKEKFSSAGNNPTEEDLREVLQLVQSALFALDDVLEDDPAGGACRHMDPKHLSNILETRGQYISVRDNIIGILEEPDVTE